MAYSKTLWVDGVTLGSAANFNKMEDGIEALDLNALKFENDYTVISSANTATTIGSITGDVVEAELYCYQNRYYSPKFHLTLSATSGSKGYIYMSVPTGSSSTRYLISYYFETVVNTKTLKVSAPSQFAGYLFGVNWIYKEV